MSITIARALVAMGLGLVAGPLACTAVETARTAERDAVRSAEPVLAPTPAVARQRGRIIGGEKARRVSAWSDDTRGDHVARARYSADVQATLARAPIPVLAPADPSTEVTATVGPHWYALTVHGDGYLLHTHGSGEARVHPHVRTTDPTHPMRTAGGFLTRNEEIWSASWIEHGIAYSFEIECDRREVAWCDNEREVLRRVEALVYIGTRVDVGPTATNGGAP